MTDKESKNLATAANSLVENQRAIDELLGTIKWVAATPDKKIFEEQMKQLEKLRKQGEALNKKIEKITSKFK